MSLKAISTATSAVATNALFGSGSDGTVTINSGTTTLTRDYSYNNITINGTGKLVTNGYTLRVLNNLDISAAGVQALSCNASVSGSNPSGGTGGGIGGGGIIAVGTPFGSFAVSGGNGSTGSGSAGAANTSQGFYLGGKGGAGSAGGNGSSGTGGAVGASNAQTTAIQYPSGNFNFVLSTASGAAPVYAGQQGTGGGGGGGDGTNTGMGGCAGQNAGPGLIIYAQNIIRGSNATAAIIQAKGSPTAQTPATPSTGNVGGSGAGGGAGGGFVGIVCNTLTGSTITNAVDVSGGPGSAGGNGLGTGLGANGGTGGNSGGYQLIVLSTNTYTYNAPNAVTGTAGGAASGTTGGTAGAGATAQYNL